MRKAAGVLVAGVLVAGGALAAGAVEAKAPALKLERVVVLMRHGVRPPTKNPPFTPAITPQAWPAWPVAPGYLTPHGAQAVTQLGRWDGASLRASGVLPAKGCPTPAAVTIVADSDQRTIATAQSWLAGAVPGCALPIDHQPQGEADQRFGPLDAGLSSLDADKAQAAVLAQAGPGGIAAIEGAQASLLARVDAIVCGPLPASGPTPACGVASQPSALAPPKPGKRPKLQGALDKASTVAQILLLEYADGKPMPDVGWGRASAQDVAQLGAFHALEFRLLARPRYIAQANLAGLLPVIAQGLTGPARLTYIAGHDTNVANLAGLLDAHWQVPGFAADDPAPGGALVLQQWRGADGAVYVRASYRAASLDQTRAAASLGPRQPAYATPLLSQQCHALGQKGLCTLVQFQALLSAP
jgi:4-phytase/acid phosphatase